MNNVRRKLGGILILAGAAVPLAFVSVAYACGVLATLHLNPRSAAPGASVSAVGGNYSSNPASSVVALRLNSRTGAVLWTGRPNTNGTIHPTFTAPTVSPGYYLIDATQTTATGASVAGTPGRAVLRIGNPSQSKRAAAALWPSGSARSGPGSPTASSVPTATPGPANGGVLVALLSATLLAGGVLVLLDDRRRGRRSAPAV